jgi:DNA-binding MarR family transcriptional regulator
VRTQVSAEAGAPEADAAARDLMIVMKQLLADKGREFFAALEAAGISFSQVKCLMVLVDSSEPLPVKELSDRLGLSVPAVSRAVEGLVQRGEVVRKEDERDRRCKLVTVTARGRGTYEQMLAVRMAGVRSFFEELEPDEREALAAAVAPIARRLER